MADTKLISLPLGGAVAGGDILYLVQNPGSTPTSVKVTASQLQTFIAAGIAAGGAAHQDTHRPGGLDVLVNNAWTDQANVFTAQQIFNAASWPQVQIRGAGQVGLHLFDPTAPVDKKHWHLFAYTDRFFFRAMDDTGQAMVNDAMTVARGGDVVINGTGGPQLQLMDNSQPADLRRWRIQNIGQTLQFHATNDAVSANTGTLTMHRSGMLQLPKLWLHGGGASPLSGTIRFGDGSGWKLVMGPDGVPAGAERFTFTDNGNLDLYGRLLAFGGDFRGRVTVGTPPGLPVASLAYAQFDIVSSGGHPSLTLTDMGQPADARRARHLHYSQKHQFDFVNDAENAMVGPGMMTLDRAGNLVVNGGMTATGAGNVAVKNATNVFTEDQQIVRGNPTFYMKDLNTPIETNLFRLLNAGGYFYIQAVNDWATATSGTFKIDRSANVTLDGNICPSMGGRYCGLDALPWEGVRSRTALVVVSDVREKRVYGKLENILDLVDELDPIIASLHTDPRQEKFPTFSAQDVQSKIDARLGTHIVHVPDDPALPLGMAYDKLVPVMWQMIKELKARIEGK